MCIMPSGMLSKHILRYLAMSYFRTVELWTLIKKKQNMKDSFLSSLLLCLGTNESRRTAKFWHCSQGALSAPEIIYLFCLPNIPSASLPSLLRVLIAFLLTAAVKAQFFFKYFFQTLNCIFLLSKLTLSSAGTFFFPDLVVFPLFIPLALLGTSLSAGTIVWTT